MGENIASQLHNIQVAQQEFDQQPELPAPADELIRLTTVAQQRLQGYSVPQEIQSTQQCPFSTLSFLRKMRRIYNR